MILGFGNNVITSLAADISSTQTAITVMPGTGEQFSALLAYEYTNKSNSPKIYGKITLTDSGETTFEICHLISVSGDTLTVLRGQEGTTAKGWNLNDVVANFATKGSESTFVQAELLQSGHFTAGVAGGSANALTLELPTTFFLNSSTDWVLRAPIIVYPNQNNTGAATLQLTMGGKVLGTYPLYKGNKAQLAANDILKDVALVCLLDNSKTFFNVANPGAIYAGLGSAAFYDVGTSGEKIPLLSTANTWSAEQFFNGRVNAKAGLELYHATPYIDFHFANSDEDYTSRIIESAKGTLTAIANWLVNGTLTAKGLATLQSGLDVTGRYERISVNGMGLLLRPATAGYSTYIMCQDTDGSNIWYLGKGSDNVNDTVLNNYKAGNNRLELKADGSVNIISSNSKPISANNQIKTSVMDALRIWSGDYGAIFRRSENNLYIIPTAKGEAENGAIGSLRPFSIALDTGIVSIAQLVLSTALPVGSGGTGSKTAEGARTNLGCGTAATMSYSTASYTGLAGSQTEAASTAQLVGLRDAVYTKTAGDTRYQLKNTASKAANGWYKDTSTGLIYQWGQASGTANAKITVTFPIAFPNACLNASLTDIWPQLSMYTAAISAKTATTLSVGLATTSVFWFAIGY